MDRVSLAIVCGLAMLSPSCSEPRYPAVSMPVLSYRSELPRVSIYPHLVMSGAAVIVVARPLVASDVCMRVIDTDGFAWHETCWQGGDSRRITVRLSKPSAYVAYLAYRVGDGWVTGPLDRASVCVLGEGSGCP